MINEWRVPYICFPLLKYIIIFQHKQLPLTVFVLTILASLSTRKHFVPIILRNESIKTLTPSSICTSSSLNAEYDRALHVSITLFSHFGLCAYSSSMIHKKHTNLVKANFNMVIIIIKITLYVCT